VSSPDPELLKAVQARFAHLSTAQLTARMNRAPAFGYDDEEVELTRRLEPTGRAWRWTRTIPPRVEIYPTTNPTASAT
jgi:hypothetical protein